MPFGGYSCQNTKQNNAQSGSEHEETIRQAQNEVVCKTIGLNSSKMSTIVKFHKRGWDFLKSRLREFEETKQRMMQEMYLGPRFKDIKTSKDINNVKSLANNSGLLEKEMATHSGILDWEIP